MKFLRKIPVPIFLLILAILTYGLFFWERGFYWDEAPWTWIYYRLGPAALTQTFSTSRPFWGLLYQVLLPIFGPRPWVWQLLMVLFRWLTAVQVWALLREVWRKDERPALWASTLFLVYPGLGQNYIALMYTHFYIILNAFLLSLYLSIRAYRTKSLFLTLLALGLAIVNLVTMEYFYFLEFFRLVLFWLVVSEPWKIRLRRAMLLFLPYFGTFTAVTLWRVLFFKNQNASYTYGTLQAMRVSFFGGLLGLLGNMLLAFWESAVHAWLYIFEPVDFHSLGIFTTTGAFALALAATLLAGLYVRGLDDGKSPNIHSLNFTLLITGLIAWVLGGGAFWLVGDKTMPQLHFSADRFTMSFMLGASLILTALIGFIQRYPRVQYTLLAVLIGFSVGKQFQINSLYRHDWDTQRSLFWQLSWRVPALKPGSSLLSNDLPVTLFSDNSLSGPLNWIYSPPGKMDHILYFASVRTQEGHALAAGQQAGIPFDQNYLAAVFHGNTSDMLVINFAPPGCLRVLDPEIDPLNKLLPPVLRDWARLSNQAMISTDSPVSLPDFYNPEIAHTWCYYFSKAELARQAGSWQQVVDLSKQAYSGSEHPNDPVENFVFIEAYAHTGKWDDARKLTRDSYKFSKDIMRPMLCALWQRIDKDTPTEPQKTAAISNTHIDLSCAK